MSAADKFLSRVEHKPTGPGRWQFRVPTRQDRHMSGALRELDDGRILLHDFGGDSTDEIMSAIGLTLEDLFPANARHHGKPERRPFPAADVLRAVAFEALVVCSTAAAMLACKRLSESDRERLILAASRIQAALTAAGVSHG